MDTPTAVHATPTPLSPLGAGIILNVELEEPLSTQLTDAAAPTATGNDQFLVEPIITETAKDKITPAGDGASAATTFVSPTPSPPALFTHSPGGASSKRGSGKFQSMDDSFCDRIRSTSSFGWYDESTAFEPAEAETSAFCQIGDWRDLKTWDGGRSHGAPEEALDVEFQVPHAHVTATKTFRLANHGRPEPYAIAIGATRVLRVSSYASHAEFQVLMSTKDEMYKSWKRFSDFKLLAEYAKISDLRDTVTVWREIQQTQRWFRCLEANYLKNKCMLLEKFLAQLLFAVPTPSLLLTFVGAQQPDFTRRR
eukprot:jgi/Undpi1/10823/HiC_scaffold_3.g01352.m1